jgi:hypothetical protein
MRIYACPNAPERHPLGISKDWTVHAENLTCPWCGEPLIGHEMIEVRTKKPTHDGLFGIDSHKGGKLDESTPGYFTIEKPKDTP